MSHDTDKRNVRLSVCHPQLLFGLLKDLGIDERDALLGTGINLQLLDCEDAQLTYEQYLKLIQRSIELTGNPQIGFEFGSRIKPTSMGLLGLGFLACGTFVEASYFLNRIVAVTNPAVHFDISEESDYLCIGIEEAYPWYECADFMVDVAASFIHNVVALYDTSYCARIKYEFCRDEVENDDCYREFLQGSICFQANVDRVYIPSDFASRTLPLESSAALKQSVAYIDKQLAALQNEHSLIIEPVKHMISINPGKIPSLQEVSDQLHMTPRTLNRRLKAAGTSFREITDQVCNDLAVEYLSNKNYTIEQISYFMGYSSAANFSKAFRRWSGLSPSEFRSKELTM